MDEQNNQAEAGKEVAKPKVFKLEDLKPERQAVVKEQLKLGSSEEITAEVKNVSN
jgi:hypothetical protein